MNNVLWENVSRIKEDESEHDPLFSQLFESCCSKNMRIYFIIPLFLLFKDASSVRGGNQKANSFLTFRVTDSEIVKKVGEVQKELFSLDKRFNSKNLQPLASLHVTLNIFELTAQNLCSSVFI